ncbi:MAG: F0F1 ATP synthase subunit B [Spirochaetales bacterium]|nr:F0F1 ATP synthase subunit B [Spirochaetales bacterium]
MSLEFLAGEGGISLLDANPGLFIWTLITFTVVMLVLRAFAWKPITWALDQRSLRIQSDLSAADSIRKEAEESLAAYRAKLAGLREEGLQIVAEARQEAEKLRARMISEAEADAAEIRRRGKRDLELARDAALADFHRQVTDLSVTVAGRIIGRELKAGDHVRLIDESLEKLRAVP